MNPRPTSELTDDDLLEVAVEEFTERWRAGERPTASEYIARYPQLADVLNELLPTIAAVEQTKSASDLFGARHGVGSDAPRQLGDFRIVREIGRGGMGIVYEAEQQSLGRSVALKVLPKQMLLEPRRVERFEQEARIAANLHHTNIVPVFGVGHDDDTHYYVMQLIDGEGWDRRLLHAERRPTPEEAARIGRDAARALHHAHVEGTLHRDVKPANILLDRRDHVWLTDFGLAQVLESDVTATAHVAGTLRYMPPERFHGVSDARGDIYSLGVTLFEAVSGRPPFDARSNLELMQKITHGEPPRLRSIDPTVPRDFETIVAKATAREPDHRYATAAEFAEDLARFLDGVPIRARKISAMERAWRWCRRNRLTAGALATAALSLVLLAAVSAVGYWRAAQLNDDLSASLVNERNSRQSAQTTSATALAALDTIFDRFASTGSWSSAPAVVGDLRDDLSAGELAQAVPSVSPQIASALEELLPFYLRLAAERGDDPRIRRQAAAAMHRIGIIQAKLGRFNEARDVWSRAAALLTELAGAQPAANVDFATAAATLDCDLGDVERIQDRYPEAREAYRRALAQLTAIDSAALTFPARRELARAHLSLAYQDRQPRQRRGPPPGPPGPRGLPGLELSGPRFGGPPPPPRGLADGRPPPFGGPPEGRPPPRPFAEPGEEEPPSQQDRAELKQHLDAAFALLEKLNAEQPGDRQTLLLLARCYRERAKSGPPGSFQVDSSDFLAGTKLLRALAADYPNVPDYMAELSAALSDLNPHDLPPQQRDAGELRLREALEISERLTLEYPQTTLYAGEQTHILNRIATMQRLDRDPQAETTYRRGIALAEKLTKQSPGVFAFAFWEARMRQSLAEHLAETMHGAQALKEAEAAVAVIANYVKSDKPPPPATHLAHQLRGLIDDLKRPK